jgi:hypothetical protein
MRSRSKSEVCARAARTLLLVVAVLGCSLSGGRTVVQIFAVLAWSPSEYWRIA